MTVHPEIKLKKADELKPGDFFAMKNSEISFLQARVLSAIRKYEHEIEIEYEYEIYGKKYQRRDLLVENSYLLVIN